MSKEPKTIDTLDELLADLHDELENGATAALVKELADRNPDHRAVIFAFTARWLTAERNGLSDDSQEIVPTISMHDELLTKFWARYSVSGADPFDTLPSEKLQNIADNCLIDMSILRKISRRLIDETTAPAMLVSWLAAATATLPGAIWSYIAAEPLAANADFFAPGGRRMGSKMSFADAVSESSLDDHNKSFWLDR